MATHKASAKAREADKLRKRAKRAKARLERDLSSGKIAAGSQKAKTAQRLISGLEKNISQSYATRGKTREYTQKAEQALAKGSEISQRLKPQPKADLTARRNKLMEVKLNEATKSNGFSTISKDEARMFYRATQKLWSGKGLSKEEYNTAIVKGLGASDLQEAYSMVMNDPKVKAALERMRNVSEDIEGYTDENEDFYEDAETENERYEVVASFTPLSFG